MKFFVTVLALMFSAQLFAASPYTFNCMFVNDTCTIEEVSGMTEIEPGLYGGVEGNFDLLYQSNTATMFIYLGDKLKGYAVGAHTMAQQNETCDGLVGIILLDDKNAGKGIQIGRSSSK